MSGGSASPASRISTFLPPVARTLAINAPAIPEPTITTSGSRIRSAHMPELLCYIIVERQRIMRPITESQLAVAHRVGLRDAPGPALGISGARNDLFRRDRKRSGFRRIVALKHLRLVPGAEIPGQDDAAPEIFDGRIGVVHDLFRGSFHGRSGAHNPEQ